MTGERGAALIGTLAIGFVFVLVIAQVLVTLGRLSAASAETAEAASYAVQYAARHGGPDDAARIAQGMVPEAEVEATETPAALSVVVRVRVPLVGPEGSPLHQTITGRATASYSPYRSHP